MNATSPAKKSKICPGLTLLRDEGEAALRSPLAQPRLTCRGAIRGDGSPCIPIALRHWRLGVTHDWVDHKGTVGPKLHSDRLTLTGRAS